jgi:hypothetical protein
MAAKSHITKKLEDVAKLVVRSFFQSQGAIDITGFDLEENIYTGRSSVDKVGPCIILYAEKGREEPLHSGNYWIRLHAIAKFPAGDITETEEDYTKLVGTLGDALAQSDLCEQLSSFTNQVDGFTAFGERPADVDSGAGEEDPDVWMDKITKEIYCCPSEIR